MTFAPVHHEATRRRTPVQPRSCDDSTPAVSATAHGNYISCALRQPSGKLVGVGTAPPLGSLAGPKCLRRAYDPELSDPIRGRSHSLHHPPPHTHTPQLHQIPSETS